MIIGKGLMLEPPLKNKIVWLQVRALFRIKIRAPKSEDILWPIHPALFDLVCRCIVFLEGVMSSLGYSIHPGYVNFKAKPKSVQWKSCTCTRSLRHPKASSSL
uniref:Uncharacterized protein n=1 Tax=Lepeophtheirus salmonis TaxID=72036 RepID=A0A0K2VDI4_LEPSM